MAALVPPTLVIDFGTATAAALIVIEQGSWLVPDPASGASRWPCVLYWDGQRMIAGAAAEQRGRVDPAGYASDIKRALDQDTAVVVGTRRLRPVEQVAEFFAALRNAAQRLLGSVGAHPVPERAVVTIPTSAGVTDHLRSQLVGAAEAAGFTAVELLVEAAGAVWAPGSPLRVGDLVLVYDLGATFEATLVRVGDDLPEILGHGRIVDWPGSPPPGREPAELTIACCRDVLARLGVERTHVAWVLPVGGGTRRPGLVPLIEQGLGIAVATVAEPELAVVRGAAVWLPRSGPRTVVARGSGHRMVPLVYTIPGGTAQLLRWLVEPEQPYEEGAAVARVRLPNGSVWDLTVRARGTVDEVLVSGGREVRSGEWLALVRPL
jgi:molecular chaperone DnaK (HSP70)